MRFGAPGGLVVALIVGLSYLSLERRADPEAPPQPRRRFAMGLAGLGLLIGFVGLGVTALGGLINISALRDKAPAVIAPGLTYVTDHWRDILVFVGIWIVATIVMSNIEERRRPRPPNP